MGLTLSQLVWAYEEADLEQLVKTNICERCNLTSADLNNLDLKNANLNSADLSYADLSYADLSGSDLSGANLIGAYLYQTQLVGVDLNSANMAGSKLSGVDLTDANLQSANINLGELQRARSESRKPKIIISPDVIALNELTTLKDKELWQSGKVKQYHSKISEILRTYLEDRFQILALELPTCDILQSLRNKGMQSEDLDTLTTILQRADLAKYAKSQPTDSENDESMIQSVSFVRNTKKKEVQND